MATLPIILLNGTTADANQVMEDFYEIYSNIDPSNVPTTAKIGTGRFVLETAIGPVVQTSIYLPPVGTIQPFYDFNAALTFSALAWHYCDGTAQTILGIGIQTLPDLSGRYLVGFGTDGGGNIGTAPWLTAAVGNAGNTINIAHVHAGPSHTHSYGGIGYTTDAHVLDITQIPAHHHTINYGQNPGAVPNEITGSAGPNDVFTQDTLDTGGGLGHSHTGTLPGGTTGASGTANTSSALSASQSIQPISIRVRFIMRIA